MLVATTGAFVAAVVYAGITYRMFHQMQVQTEQSDRAWLTVEMVIGSGFTFDKDGGATITVIPVLLTSDIRLLPESLSLSN